MPRPVPNAYQNFLASVVLPILSIFLLPVSLIAVGLCVINDKIRQQLNGVKDVERSKGCVIISGGRMTKGLTLARAFKRAGWKVIGVEEQGWGEYCPLRFSSSVSSFHLLPPAATSYTAYSSALQHLAKQHQADLFIPVSGVASSVEDAQAADEMYANTQGRCRTFIQDPETMKDLHDKDRFMALVDRLGMKIPAGRMINNVNEAISFLKEQNGPRFVFKCMGIDENRGDMTLFPIKGDDKEMSQTRRFLEGLRSKITKENPYVFQEFIPGQEWCTHASVIRGRLTSFVAAPSNDMLMTYENATTSAIGRQAEEWTTTFLNKLQADPIPGTNATRGLTGHFSFDFIVSTTDGTMYPIECNARVHTAVILLPLDGIANCYDDDSDDLDPDSGYHRAILRPLESTRPRSWIYNDLIMRYLPQLLPPHILEKIHPSLPACSPHYPFFNKSKPAPKLKPSESPWLVRVDPTLVADDWVPFLVLWHVFWPGLLLGGWIKGRNWTRLNVSTGRIFEA